MTPHRMLSEGVDRLRASHRYGERWAALLDIERYSARPGYVRPRERFFVNDYHIAIGGSAR